MNAADLCYLPALELAQRIRARELSPVEVTGAVLARVEALQPRLNAYCTLLGEQAMAQARAAEAAVMAGEPLGPLHGVPYSVKDLLITAGVRTMRGSRIHEHDVPTEDAPAVARLKAAGGILLGKTCTPEFGWKGVTDSPLTGVTRNPWNPELTPGGSSGGAAAQVAAGLGPLAVGSDGGGSVRIPAAFSGVFGFKPTFGRVPVYPHGAFDALSHVGPITRTVADAALMLAVMAGPDPADRLCLESAPADYLGELRRGVAGLRVGWSPDLGRVAVNPELAVLAAAAARTFEELGCRVEEVQPGWDDPPAFFGVFWLSGAAGMLGDLLDEWGDRMDPGLVRMVRRGQKLSAMALVQAQMRRHQFYDRVRRFFERYDLLLTPTMPVFPFAAGVDAKEGLAGERVDPLDWTPFTYPFNLTHSPAASVPAGFSADGRPAGLQIVGRRLEDLTVLRAAAAYEQARPWAQRRPAL